MNPVYSKKNFFKKFFQSGKDFATLCCMIIAKKEKEGCVKGGKGAST